MEKEREKESDKSKEIKEKSSKDKDREKERERDRDRDRKDKDKDKDRDRDRERDREKDKDKDKDKDRDRERDRDRDRDRERDRERRSSRDKERSKRDRSKSPKPSSSKDSSSNTSNSSSKAQSSSNASLESKIASSPELESYRRAEKTVFVSQLHPKVSERDLFQFFSLAGRVSDIRLITDPKSGKSKGHAYVEMKEKDFVIRALALNGQLLGGYPVTVQNAQLPKLPPHLQYALQTTGGDIAAVFDNPQLIAPTPGLKIYVGSLHYSVAEEDIRPIFEAFGPVLSIDIHKDPMTGQSKGFAFIHFRNVEDAQTALGALNGIEIAGRQIKVGYTAEAIQQLGLTGQPSALPSPSNGAGPNANFSGRLEEEDGLSLGGRQSLMQKLAAQHGVALPPNMASNANNSSNSSSNNPAGSGSTSNTNNSSAPLPILNQPTCYLVIKNMFDPSTETGDNWMEEIRSDVLDEASKCGKVLHIVVHVDRYDRSGLVYVKMDSVASSCNLQQRFNGRWYNSRTIQVDFVPEMTYTIKFPEAK